MKALNQEARASLSAATAQDEGVKQLEELVRVLSSEREAEVLWRAFIRMGRQEGDITIRRRDGTEIAARYLAGSHLLPGIHVSVMAKI